MLKLKPVKSGEDILPGLIIFLFSFVLMVIYSVSPTVYAGDSSLFSAAAFHMGTAHPPAYPLLAILGKLATFIPLGNIAFRVNLLSMICGTLTATLAYEAAKHITSDRLTSVLAPLVVLASPLFILESSKAEAYSLNALLNMSIFLLALKAVTKEHPIHEILIAFFLLGLGMGNHHTIGFIMPLLLLLLYLKRKDLTFRVLPLSGAAFTAGISVYLYVFFRTSAEKGLIYTQASSFHEFIKVFFRLAYSGNTLTAFTSTSEHAAGWFYAAKNLLALISSEITTVALALGVLALAANYKNRKFLYFMVGSLVIWLPLAKMTMASASPSQKAMEVISPYYLQIIPFISVLSAMGLFTVKTFIQKRSKKVSWAAVMALLVFQAMLVPLSIQKSSLSDYYIAHTWINDVSRGLPPGSIYITSGDNPSFMSYYAFQTERLRDDILVLNSSRKGNTIDLSLSPKWKYGEMFPELYEKEDSLSLPSLDRYARNHMLFTNSYIDIADIFLERFDVQGHPLSYMLTLPGSEYSLKENYIKAFQKIDYLPVVIGLRKDILTTELNNMYSFSILQYAKMLAEDRHKDAEYYFKLAYFLGVEGYRLDTLKNYIIFVAVEHGPEKAEGFIKMIESSAEDPSNQNIAEQIRTWYMELDHDAIQHAFETKAYIISSMVKE